jgi:hypothetical protein
MAVSGPRVTVDAASTAESDRLRGELRDTEDELRRAREEVAGLRREQDFALDDWHKARKQVEQLKAELAQARTKLRKTRTTHASAGEGGPWFTDEEDQFRYEVFTAWVRRIPAAEKPDRLLADYLLGPRFLDSVRTVQGIPRAKIVDVVMEVLTGLANQQSSREVHILRSSLAGGASPRTREDGASCWRVSLQVNTPSARRLHYWRLADDTIELSRVVLHDDYEP